MHLSFCNQVFINQNETQEFYQRKNFIVLPNENGYIMVMHSKILDILSLKDGVLLRSSIWYTPQ